MKPKEFEALKSALKDALSANPKDFANENDRLWKEITSHEYWFDRQEGLVETLPGVTRDEFVEHFEALFYGPKARRLDIQMLTEAHKQEQEWGWERNSKGNLFTKVLKRELFEGSVEDFKEGASYYPDAVKEAWVANAQKSP